MTEIFPRLEILPPSQRRIWPELCAIPKDFVLYGGTALALHLGHRESADFDFFGGRKFDVRALETGIPFLAGAKIIQRAEEGTKASVIHLRDLPEAMKLRLVTAARETDLDHLPGIEPTGRDFGHEL